MLLRGRLHLAPSGRCNPRHRRRKSRRAFVRPGALPRLGTSPTASIYLPRSRSEGFSAIMKPAGEPSRVRTRFSRLNEIVAYGLGEKVFETYWRIRGGKGYDVAGLSSGSSQRSRQGGKEMKTTCLAVLIVAGAVALTSGPILADQDVRHVPERDIPVPATVSAATQAVIARPLFPTWNEHPKLAEEWKILIHYPPRCFIFSCRTNCEPFETFARWFNWADLFGNRNEIVDPDAIRTLTVVALDQGTIRMESTNGYVQRFLAEVGDTQAPRLLRTRLKVEYYSSRSGEIVVFLHASALERS